MTSLPQGKNVLANGFLKVVLADFGRTGINSLDDPEKWLRLRHAHNMWFAESTSYPAIRNTGSLADVRQTFSDSAHIRR